MTINFRKIMALGAVLALAFVLASSASAQGAEDIYKTKCASCHAADGSGNTPIGTKLGVKSFGDPELAKKPDAEWIEITTNGKGKMPAYKGKLTDDQIKELIKYSRSLATK